MSRSNFTLFKKGSTKDIYSKIGDTKHLYFQFSDRYSVFDYGEMPDQLKGKGKVLSTLAVFFFNQLADAQAWRELGLPTERRVKSHFSGIESVEGFDSPMLKMKKFIVPQVQGLQPGSYDYSSYLQRPVETLIPLEVIFRFSLVEGSSLLRRQEDAQVRADLDLGSKVLKAGDQFSSPLIEFTTKLEKKDRPLSYAQAQEMAGLKQEEFTQLQEQVKMVALFLKKMCDGKKLELVDGKVEFAFGQEVSKTQRELILIDSIGPDEMRILANGEDLSKEHLRQYYRQSEWYKHWTSGNRQATPLALPAEVKSKAERNYEFLEQTLCAAGER